MLFIVNDFIKFELAIFCAIYWVCLIKKNKGGGDGLNSVIKRVVVIGFNGFIIGWVGLIKKIKVVMVVVAVIKR